ncbi:class I SAM-dependent methyltransferase [Rufibacter psychrotolerans]|uniref:class I SAM-dependent methyltransferase n=1 Tax=Rufibacter psychrotolerans TaxID=2812556 RepID=UPI0019671796|nr:class I SAM-dependent methyltransferase [Rufibacter sp. SYSU D00308]
MAEFWESSFQEKQTMWGFRPAASALEALHLFQRSGGKHVLIPGFGYGRNASPFTEHGFKVTGIEISETAIALAKKRFGDTVNVYHGAVSAMPFDQELYDGIFCYALIHLLNSKDRAKLVRDCYHQLKPGGYMVFVAISKEDAAYGQGEKVSKDRFLTRHGVTLFFYDAASVEKEFGAYGLVEATQIQESATPTANRPSQCFWRVLCRKEEDQ